MENMNEISPEIFPIALALVLLSSSFAFSCYAFYKLWVESSKATAPSTDDNKNESPENEDGIPVPGTLLKRQNSWTGMDEDTTDPSLLVSSTLRVDVEQQQQQPEGNSNTHPESPPLLAWKDLACTYPSKRSGGKSTPTNFAALSGCGGEMRATELVAIMGRSGSGKSTLLDILSGRKTLGNLSGSMSILGHSVLDLKQEGQQFLRHVCSYVPQRESFFPTQTPEEAVAFVANLKLGRDARGDHVRDERVQTILDLMGISKEARKRPIGGSLAGGLVIRGLSGGERKRLALACAVAAKPSILFLDEITSGLDSENAILVVSLLKNMCKCLKLAAAVVIHQPSFEVFDCFDRLILLSHGDCMYSDRIENVSTLYSNMGVPMPDHFYLAGDLLKRASAWDAKTQPEVAVLLPQLVATTGQSFDSKSNRRSQSTPSMYWQFSTVLHRSLLNHYLRNLTNLAARVGIYASTAAFFGCFFWKVAEPPAAGDGDTSLSNEQAQIVLGAGIFLIQAAYLLPFAQVSTFFFDKKVFMEENPIGLYPPWMYSISQFLLESWALTLGGVALTAIAVPMMGLWNPVLSKTWSFFTLLSVLSLSGVLGNAIILLLSVVMVSQDLAFLLGSSFVTVCLAASGGFVPFTAMEEWIVWVQWISPVKYSLQGFAAGLFRGTDTTYASLIELDTPDTVSANCAVLVAFFGTFAILTMLALSLQKEVR